jgi:hypothetical protein
MQFYLTYIEPTQDGQTEEKDRRADRRKTEGNLIVLEISS